MISSDVYEEVYEVLGYMDKTTVMKIPEEILVKIKENRNSNFKTKINKENIFDEQNISKEAVDLLCWLDYTYWMDDDSKSKIDKINKEIQDINEKEKREKYNPDNIFKNRKIEKTNNLPIEIEKINFWKKIIQYVQKFFNKWKHKLMQVATIIVNIYISYQEE